MIGNAFDVQYKLLPPKLQMQLWVLALDANTSKVNLAYKSGIFCNSLAYKYGGSAQASFSIRRTALTLGVNPSNRDLDLGLVFRGFKFGASANVAHGSAGVSLSYGASLLPFPWELSSKFNSAAGGLQSMASDISSSPNNPLEWFKLHSDDVGAINNVIRAGQQISKGASDHSNRLGAALRLNYAQKTGLTIYGGVQLFF